MTAVSPVVEAKRTLAHALIAKSRRRVRTPVRRGGGKPLDLLTWSFLHRQYLRPNVHFSLHDHLYLKGMYLEAGREVIFMKAGQIGISELLISYAIHGCDERASDVLYMMPTIRDVSEFSQSRFGPALEASPYLDGIVVGSGRTTRGADKVSMKRIRYNWLYLRGGNVDQRGGASQLKSIPVDILIGDEIDEMDNRAMPIARKRLGHSPIKEVRQASTPSYHGVGIHEEWEGSDQREWHVPCPHCGHKQQLLIDNVVEEWDALGRPFVWHGQEEGRAWIACVKCGKEMNRLSMGEWVPTYPGRDVIGYHPTKLMAAHTPLIDVVRNLQTIDETERKEAVNQDLGLPHTPKGGRLERTDLDACRREYAHGPVDGIPAYMGVDVGKALHVVIRQRQDKEGNKKQLFAGAVVSFDDVGRLMKKYGVKTCVIDALPETRSARAFQAGFRDKAVWLCYYVGGDTGVKKTAAVDWDYRNGIVNADRTRTLDSMYAGFYDESNILPAAARNIPDYYDHMVEMIRTIEKKPDGTSVARYVREKDDHFAHAENYAAIAALRPLGWVG